MCKQIIIIEIIIKIEIITWNHIIIRIKQEYLKLYNYVQIICIR